MAETDPAQWAHYSRVDKILHKVAFLHPGLQRVLGSMDQDIFAPKSLPAPAGEPVFITGLPRAGTTLLLEFLAGSGDFASFTYRHMPFVLAPILWEKLTGGSRKAGEKIERSHGDGMAVDFDSPEAFEEVAWIAFHGKDYIRGDHLMPMDQLPLDEEFSEFLTALSRRLAVTSGDRSRRYLSKNNANIGRLKTLPRIFPDAQILICLRDPVAQAASLQSQHELFLRMHKDDAFARNYMKWIGHFDFGETFKPIRFSDPLPQDGEFWLKYWIDAYSYARDAAGPNCHFFCYENLREHPVETLSGLADCLSISDKAGFIANQSQIRAPRHMPDEGPKTDLEAEALALYEDLRQRAL